MPESAEPIECVRRIDFDEREVRAVGRVAAAGTAVAEAGADVDVGPDCEPPDESGRAKDAVGAMNRRPMSRCRSAKRISSSRAPGTGPASMRR